MGEEMGEKQYFSAAGEERALAKPVRGPSFRSARAADRAVLPPFIAFHVRTWGQEGPARPLPAAFQLFGTQVNRALE